MLPHRFAFLLCAALAVMVSPALVSPKLAEGQAAGEPSQSEMAAARALFQSGIEHGGADRWIEALTDFERSYAIVPIPVTLLNLAGAQAELGRVVAATESYRRFLAEASTGRARRYRARAQTALAAAEARVAHLTLTLDGLLAEDTLAVDGHELSRAMIGVAMPLDPGEHLVSVLRDGDAVAEHGATLVSGARETLLLWVPAPEPAVDAAVDLNVSVVDMQEEPAVDLSDDGGSIIRSPWLWVGVGAVVVGAVVTALVVSQSGGQGMHTGNLGPGVVTFD